MEVLHSPPSANAAQWGADFRNAYREPELGAMVVNSWPTGRSLNRSRLGIVVNHFHRVSIRGDQARLCGMEQASCAVATELPTTPATHERMSRQQNVRTARHPPWFLQRGVQRNMAPAHSEIGVAQRAPLDDSALSRVRRTGEEQGPG